MLIYANNLIGTPILSMQAGGRIGYVSDLIVDPNTLKIIAVYVQGATPSPSQNILDVKSIREYSNFGAVIDSADEFIEKNDVVKIKNVIDLNFKLSGLKVETKKKSNLGKIIDFTVTHDNFTVEQLIVKRPTLKSFLDSELTIPRSEIVEITDDKVIVRDEEKTIRARAENEDFIPNFVNPFRTVKPASAKED